MNYSEQLYSQVLQDQNTLQNKMKNETDAKASKKNEKDLILISNLLITLTKYNNFKNRESN